jgi:hypothetical protein
MSKVQAKVRQPGEGAPKRDLLVGLVLFAVFVVVAFGALMVLNPANAARLRALGIRSPVGTKPIDLTLLHTNDTWGYLETCG